MVKEHRKAAREVARTYQIPDVRQIVDSLMATGQPVQAVRRLHEGVASGASRLPFFHKEAPIYAVRYVRLVAAVCAAESGAAEQNKYDDYEHTSQFCFK